MKYYKREMHGSFVRYRLVKLPDDIVELPEDDKEDVELELDKLCAVANEHKNNSSFDTAFSEFCYDVFAGTGCMLVLPSNPRTPILFKAIPIREYCIEEGANGEVVSVYRKYSMRRELINQQWGDAKEVVVKEADKERDIELLECTYFDYDLNIWHYMVINISGQTSIVEREYKTNPFIVLRWNKCAGEPYGRGVGLTALNDIKTLNLIKEYSLRNFAFNIPPLLVQEDAMLDVESLELTPFSLNVVPDTKTSIVPLQISTDHGIESYKVQELTMDIKRNTLGSTLPNEGSRELTATEVVARQGEMRKNLNSVFGRLINEFQIPLVRRIFDVLIETKLVKEDEKFNVAKMNGFVFKIVVNTPISRLLQSSEAQSIMHAISYLMQIDPTGQMISKLLKTNEIGNNLMELMGVPNRFVNSIKEIEGVEKQMADQQQAQQAQAVQTDVGMANAKEMGKAEAEIAKNETI